MKKKERWSKSKGEENDRDEILVDLVWSERRVGWNTYNISATSGNEIEKKDDWEYSFNRKEQIAQIIMRIVIAYQGSPRFSINCTRNYTINL